MEASSRNGIRRVRGGNVGQSSLRSEAPFGLTQHLASSAADEISGETVAIKMVTRVFDKIQLAKRALREITLLRHFANHENITGLIDVDAITQDFNEMCVHVCTLFY
jgi:serine/threonine protein kinase